MTIKNFRRWLMQAGPLLAVCAVCGCASSPAGDPVTTIPAAGEGAEYIIGPGDQLSIFVWRNTDLSIDVPVRPDGRISSPLVEDMVAAGKTPTQLSKDIEAVLAEYIRTPKVTVIVGGFVGTFGEQIRVVGQATRPQALAYRDRMTVLDVMIEVGGLTPEAAGNRAKLVRYVGGQQQEYPVRLHDLLNRGRIEANVPLRPGDVLIIPESVF
ncbi:MAG: XrtA/PEP-CTERM system exopolysaccharide export protein [Pseudomonadota bacterium]